MSIERTPWIVAIVAALAAFAVGCGNGGPSSGSSGGSQGTPIGAPSVTEKQPPPPPPLKSRILGRWDMPMESLVATLPPEKRADVLTVELIFRDEEPTEAEIEAAGLKGVGVFGIGLLRQEKTKNPTGEKIAKMRAAYEKMHEALPSMEVTANKLTLGGKAGQETSTYTILRETPQNVVLRVVDDDDGEVEELTFTLVDDNTLVISKPGDPDLAFWRQGVPRPTKAVTPEPPDLRETPAAARLIGRWNAVEFTGGVSFRPDGSYVIHGAGGDIDGRWRLDTVEGNRYVVRTTITSSFSLGADTIDITFADDGSITWTNRGTGSTSHYTKVQ